METGEFAPGRKPTRCPSPDIADEMYQLAQKRSARLKEKRPPVEDNNRSVVEESESKEQTGEGSQDGLSSEIPSPQPVVAVGGRGKRGRGRGRGGRGKRGGRGRGRGKSITRSDSQVLQEDSVDQIEHTVKGLALSSSSSADNTLIIKEEPNSEKMDVVEQSLDNKPTQEGSLNTGTEDLASIFTFKEESYQPGFIPGLDFSAEGSTSYLSSASSDIKPVSEIVSEITDDFFIPDDDSGRVRRSSRIKSLEGQKGRGRRREVVFSSASSIDSTLSKSLPNLNDEDSNSYHGVSSAFDGGVSPNDSISSGVSSFGLSSTLGLPAAKFDDGQNSKPFKVKSRWRYSADAESMKTLSMESLQLNSSVTTDADKESSGPTEDEFVPSRDLIKKQGHLTYNKYDVELVDKLKKFQGIEDSIFRKERKISKESKGMVCDCFLTTEDIERGEHGCIEDCLNRLLMVECGPRCPTGESCMNKKFQRKQYAALEVFKTEKKGHGLRTLQLIPEGGFVIEYVGEVLDPFQFESRTKEYAKGNQEHFYFMALKADSIIDATLKGNCSRFINHSCEPNCETQKWTVNGELRIGFFTLRDLKPGEEIVFDYQFQRYGKKAQRCYCGTQSCRGWIGEEDDDDAEYDDKETDVAEAEVRSPDEDTEALEIEKAEKKKRRAQLAAERKQRKDARIRVLEDAALEEELSQLERSGLKNRTHTLTLSRLMVRAEKWDDRERILNILINGDPACRRLFLDYRGLKLMYNWMINLPLPVENITTQVIKNEEYHLLFLKTLASLSIPNKTMLLDSKILSLMDTWSNTPKRTPIEIATVPPDVCNQQPTDSATDLTTTVPDISTVNSSIENETIQSVTLKEEQPDKMEVDEICKDPVGDCDEKPMEENIEVEEKYNIWSFQNIAQTLITSWADLKEVFRIPKKERVEQMKEHEREADKGSSPLPANDSISSYSYDQGRSKWGTNRNGRDRRLPTTDSLYRGQPRIKDLYPHLSKEQRRKMFAQKVAQEEEDMRQRRMQDEMIIMHQHRCSALGLDPSTTPVVDISGHYYLDPTSIQWRRIIPNDPGLPPGIQQMLNAAKAKETIQLPPEPAESEYVFPPWPEGLPPPPPLPPASLPDGWKMAVDDEGRCYYYHLKTQQTQWTPPTAEDCQRVLIESSESSDSEAIEEEEDTSDNVKHTPPPSKSVSTIRTRLFERAKRRKKTGLVQERIISPRTENDKSTISKAVIRARKLEVLEEKRQKAVEDAQMMTEDDNNSVVHEENTESLESSDEMIKTPSPKLTIPSNAELSLSISGDDDDDSDDIHASSSPIETELDISLASIVDDNYGSPTAPPDSMILIPGLDPILDRVSTPSTPSSSSSSVPPVVGVKKERSSKHERKQKTMAYKKIASDKSKEQFRSQIANVVVTHLNPYKKPDCKTGRIVSTEDFKHLARKMTHAILLKELKHSRGNKPLEVTDGVKQKTKEYVKKFMGRFGNSNYIPSPEDSSQK